PHHFLSTIFHSTPPRPPRSPLFPYTTLFRSALGRRRSEPRPGLRGAVPAHDGLRRSTGHARRQADERPHRREQPLFRAQEEEVVDRKSTRLNSSHDQISYAVFCLKKKKKRNE